MGCERLFEASSPAHCSSGRTRLRGRWLYPVFSGEATRGLATHRCGVGPPYSDDTGQRARQ